VRLLGFEVRRPTPRTASLRWFLNITQPEVAVDVGANEGEFAADLRSVAFKGQIIAVEPIPDLAKRLREGGLTVHAVAASDTDGTVELAVAHDSRLSSIHPLNAFADRLWKNDIPERAIIEQRVEVPMRRLDTLLADVPGRLFVKLDTQGHDLRALDGLSGVIDRVVAIQTELAFQPIYDGAPSAGEHIDTVTRMGFALTFIEPIFRTPDMALVEADGLFIRRTRSDPA
jgi:FkbM family methyltransferase